MRRTSILLAGFAALALVLSPGLADARAGGGSSFGSRGSMTYSAPPSTRTAPYSAAPLQRSMTPYQSSPGYRGGYGYQGGGIMHGLMGGLFAAGLFGLVFGHGFMGGGLGLFGLLGLVLQIVIVVAVVRFLFRMFLGGRSPVMAGGPNVYSGGGGMMGAGPGAGPSGPPTIPITPADYQQFEQLLKGIQAAWSAHDLSGLQAMATPEMVSYFAEQLAQQVSRGVRNVVDDVRLVSGDLAQAWTEQGRDYATVAMRFSMVDVTRDATGRVVDGSPNEHVTATEIWTFVRSRGGHWILSAIQQTR
ncbi:MAG TPA: TIM44-like domain-containing protein, partial [Rhodopila sp.]